MLKAVSSTTLNPDVVAFEISEALNFSSAVNNPDFYRVYHLLKSVKLANDFGTEFNLSLYCNPIKYEDEDIGEQYYSLNVTLDLDETTGIVEPVMWYTNDCSSLRHTLKEIQETWTDDKIIETFQTYLDEKYKPISMTTEQQKALLSLSDALNRVAQLCVDGKKGEVFNNDVLSDRLGNLWPRSIDEMAAEIKNVAESANIVKNKQKQPVAAVR